MAISVFEIVCKKIDLPSANPTLLENARSVRLTP